MQQNTARKISPLKGKRVLHNQNDEIQIHRNTYKRREVTAVFAAITWFLVLAIFVVASNVKVSVSQNRLQNVTEQVNRLNTSNSNSKQEISELSSRSRLESIAKHSGLAMNSKNVRNVTK